MKKIKNFLDWLLPPYARLPALALILADIVCYYGTKAIDAHRVLHPISTALDDALPLVPAFIFIYVLAYAQWALAIVTILRDSRERCFRVVSAVIWGMLLAMLAMLLYPTVMTRPQVEVRDLATWLLDRIYRADAPTHVFPSMHCLCSWLCFRGSLGLKKLPRWFAWAQLGFTLLVFASVVLVKQHVWPDILGGVAAAELGLLLTRLLRLDRLFARLDLTRRAKTPSA